MIVGTAGHIDHGKTALVKALTGTDTDRLAEEKRRGITLELGFAHLTLDGGRTLGVVDVPGHERFVKAMAAGAGGIDLALLVIAIDEGVMPQTREHLDICRLLGVKSGLVVLTKSDLLPGLGDEWLELLKADVAALVEGTFLEDQPVIACSARTGAGLEILKAALDTLSRELPSRPSEGPLYLPVDRAFSLKGFGTVVTGPLLSGTLLPEEEVSLLPGLEGPFRVRGLQTHGAFVKRAGAGERTAVNLTHLEAEQVSRGMALTRAGELPESRLLDVELTALPALEAPLPRRRKLLLHLGTAQVPATCALLSGEALAPGETTLAQLRLAHPIAALPKQHFILRGTRALPGRGATLAGGRVLNIAAPRRRKPDALEKLRDAATPEAQTKWQLTEAGPRGRTATELFARTGLSQKVLTRALDALSTKGEIVLIDRERRLYVEKDALRKLRARALATLQAFHRAQPREAGMPLEALRTQLELEPRLHQRLLTLLTAREGEELEPPAEVDRERVRLTGQGRTLTGSESELRTRLVSHLTETGLAPPTLAELTRFLGLPSPKVLELLRSAQGEGWVQRISEELYFAAEPLTALKQRLVALLELQGSITTQEFKELVGQSRKFVIPLSEYFDRERVTLRVGEKRVLRRA